ncbi:peptidylprolyl isomerase [uncultured Erythrobacter sp.]|uniref:peptidylprolyl isomerase n=1 Tax=uncultured Erythrobacter sp. TaxID=263913 RepID=UPI002630BA0C|nr:peptidylprolyl isomerase [uncultured Erythrobacter sp.]
MTLPGWTREPLVHFLVAGFVLFALLGWRGEPVDPASRLIEVDRDTQAQLALRFERTMGRAPTDAELDAKIERFVRDEVLHREALRLGLDQGDAVVRQRMVAKMDMSASAAAEGAEPDEAALRAFFEENRARYSGAGEVSFDQLYFGDENSARAALANLNSQSDWQSIGEPISLPATMDDVSSSEVEKRFGEAFAGQLSELDSSGEWSAPIQSGFGWHLVRLRNRASGDGPDFEAIRDRVENDWRSEEIAQRKERAFQVLRDGYRVEIDR